MLSAPFALERPPGDGPLLFDDAPLESILYGESGGATPADLFGAARPLLDAIGQAITDGRKGEALGHMRGLYDAGLEVPTPAASEFVAYVGRFVPACAWPILPTPHFPYDTILQPIFEWATIAGQSTLADSAGSLLARYFEAHGRFADARAVLSVLLDTARVDGDRLAQAQHSNNMAYELLQESDWLQAEGLSETAVDLFGEEGATSRANNARANWLTARFGRLGLPDATTLEPVIAKVHRFYLAENDPRCRKTFVLLARIHEHAGRIAKAIALMEDALSACREVPTQHRQEDEAYLMRLRKLQRPQSRLAS